MDPDKDRPAPADDEKPAAGADPDAAQPETDDELTAQPEEGASGEQPTAREEDPRDTRQAGVGGGIIGPIALAIAIAAGAAAGYLWYRLEVQQKHRQELAAANLMGELKGVSESVRALEKRQDQLSTEQNQLSELIQKQLADGLAKLEQQQQALTGSVSKIYESLDRSVDSWALEEVEQLLRMANHSVALEGDTGIAVTALALADSRLEQIGNPDLLDIRRRIAEEITQLKSINQVDLPGLAFRLSSLIATVDDLPLDVEPSRPMAADGDAAAPQGENPWLNAGHELLADLKGLVRIQNVTESAKPLLTPQQRYYLLENLRLMLSGAQIAALRTDTRTFQSNLKQASQWLGEYFDTQSTAVQAMRAELDDMAGLDLTPERPSITASLTELQRVKERMTAQ